MESFMLTIPEAIAIVGSVATVVLGAFGYLLKTRSTPIKDKAVEQPHTYLESQVQGAHDRISDIKDRVNVVEGDVKLTVAKLEALRDAMKEHQQRDDMDHDVFDKKIDKLMDILIKILTDDNL